MKFKLFLINIRLLIYIKLIYNKHYFLILIQGENYDF